MTFPTRGFSHDLAVGPAKIPKVISKGNACKSRCGGRAAALANRDIVRNLQRKEGCFFASAFEHLAIGIQDEMIFDLAANLRVAATRLNRIVRR
jgi:hypothetical protein